MRSCLTLLFALVFCNLIYAQEVDYGYPSSFMNLNAEGQSFRMSFMDVKPAKANGNSVILFHGKNFNGFYWKYVIGFLSDAGYRVIVPDQVGWGKSSAPDIHYSFHLMAAQNKRLLDSLGITKLTVIGHSMGGMLATRFALMYPAIVSNLILEDPIGLEDYKTFVPYSPTDSLYKAELSATYESYRKYQQTYYPVWKPEYEPLVQAQAAALTSPDFNNFAWANALTYQMIYEQPVCYEFQLLKVHTLLIIGQADRTIVGKDKLSGEVAAKHGNYSELGRLTKALIPDCELAEFPGVGHIPHIQEPMKFNATIGKFLNITSH